MDRWIGKVAVVTGASAGIGAAIAIDLTKAGMIVIGLARRQERVDELKAQLPSTVTGVLHSYKCDVSDETQVIAAFAWIVAEFGGVDVLINNAGIVRTTQLIAPNNSKDVRDVLNTNVLALVWCTREAFASMKGRGVDGHVVLINSVVGHIVPVIPGTPSINIYPPSKHAVTAMTEVLRQEFQAEGTKIKITVSLFLPFFYLYIYCVFSNAQSISPGFVKTEIVPAAVMETYKDMAALESEDVSAAVLYVLGTPPRVQV